MIILMAMPFRYGISEHRSTIYELVLVTFISVLKCFKLLVILFGAMLFDIAFVMVVLQTLGGLLTSQWQVQSYSWCTK